MKTGKVPETVLKRSVLNKITHFHPQAPLKAGVGEDCALVIPLEGQQLLLSTDPITAADKNSARFAVHAAANDLAAGGGTPIGVMLTVLLPPDTEEGLLRELMEQADETAGSLGMTIMGGHTEVTPVVNRPLLSVTGIGWVREGTAVSTGGGKPGQDLVVTKWIGLEGTAILADRWEERLSRSLPSRMIETGKGMLEYLSVLPEARVAADFGAGAMHDVTEGGIFGALWELAEASGTGLNVDLKKLPVRQETIEICEVLGVNPYQLLSGGSLLIAADHGSALVQELSAKGIPAAVVGVLTAGNDRVVVNGEDVRYLEPPGRDEIYKVMET